MHLHHRSGQVAYRHLEVAVEFFTTKLGFHELVRMGDGGVVFLRQTGASVDVQLVGMPRLAPQKNKEFSHIGFVTDEPHRDRESLRDWFEHRGHATVVGQWSERELWLDVPDVFLDFVIEVFSHVVLSDAAYPPFDE